jgi:CMP-N-acetylneuraminic acid synthetase
LPRKNLLPFCGKPLIAYSIDVAQQAAEAGAPIDRIVVSTEDAEIATIAREWGAEVPFMRPPELARADTPSLPVVQHALDTLEKEYGFRSWDWVLLLQPTSPLRTAGDIARSLILALQPGTSAVVSVTSANTSHPVKLKLIVNGVLKPYLGETLQSQRRQDFGFVFKTNGAIYLTRRDVLMEQDSFFGDCPRPLVMPPERSLDIDTKLDFEISEIICQKLQVHEPQDPIPCTAQVK